MEQGIVFSSVDLVFFGPTKGLFIGMPFLNPESVSIQHEDLRAMDYEPRRMAFDLGELCELVKAANNGIDAKLIKVLPDLSIWYLS